MKRAYKRAYKREYRKLKRQYPFFPSWKILTFVRQRGSAKLQFNNIFRRILNAILKTQHMSQNKTKLQ